MADKFLNSTGVVHLWKKISDYFISRNELIELNKAVFVGYFYNDLFYEDSSYTVLAENLSNKLYADVRTNTLYRYDNKLGYIQLTAGSLSGEKANGISSVILNDDYTLTINFTDETNYTTRSIRGEKGIDGKNGCSIYSTSSLLPESNNETDDTDIFEFDVNKLDNYAGELIKTGDYVIGVETQCLYTVTDVGSEDVVRLKLLFSIKGETGAKGESGKQGNGIVSISLDEANSTDEQSVYIITLSNNDTYSFSVFHGKDGKTGLSGNSPQIRINVETNEWEISDNNGLTWNTTKIKATGETGADGLSAYQIAVNNDFEGSEEEWLNSLKGARGEKGNDGISVTHEWDGTYLVITSSSGVSSVNLKGEKGDSGENGKDGIDGTSPVIRIGDITTLPSNSQATVTLSGDEQYPVLNFGIPKGADGDSKLPEVTSDNNGNFLRVVDGEWTAVTIPDAEGAKF